MQSKTISIFFSYYFLLFFKHHSTEFVRYYCEQCEVCICIACTYVDHRDHELADFRTAAANHKAYINECLDGCKSRIKEQELVQQILELYGEETNEFIKRREELDEYFEQIKNTCSLTELVIHGKDIELLLVKKQLMDKFRELDAVELDPLPENICMRIDFQPGQLNLGTLKICEMTPLDDDEREGEVEEEEEADAALEEEEEEEENVNVEEKKTKNDVEISNINSEPTKTFASIATQTEDMTTITTTTQAVQVRETNCLLIFILFSVHFLREF
jgi:hypothetical protein